MRFRSRRVRRRLLFCLAVIACGSATVLAWKTVRREQSRRLVATARIEGMAAFEEGDYATALERLSYYVTHKQDDAEAMLAFADARAGMPEPGDRHLPEAVQLYKVVLRLGPENIDALTPLLHLYGRLDLRVEALEVVDRILAIDARHRDALAIKAASLRAEGDFENAAHHLQTLIEIEPDEMRWRIMLLELQRDAGEDLAALRVRCDAWIRERPDEGKFHVLKAEVLLDHGDFESSRAEAEQACAKGVSSMQALSRLVRLLDAMQTRGESTDGPPSPRAETVLAETRARLPSEPWVYEVIIQRHWKLMQLDEALAVVADAESRLGRLDVSLLRWKALLNAIRENGPEAESALARLERMAERHSAGVPEVDPGTLELIRARLATNRGDWPAALRGYATTLSLRPFDPIAHFLLGEARQRLDEHELALRSFGVAIRLDRRWVAPHLAQVESLLALRRSADAIEHLLATIRDASIADARPHVLLARSWLDLGDDAEAPRLRDPQTGERITLTGLLERLAARPDTDAEVIPMLVEAYAREGRRDDARRVVDRALAAEGANPVMLLALVDPCERWEIAEPQALLDAAVARGAARSRLAAIEADVLARKGLVEAARARLEQACREAERSHDVALEVWLVRARFVARYQPDDALSALQALLARFPDEPAVHTLVLSQPSAWTSQPLIERSVDALAAVAGDRSPRVLLARAMTSVRFHPGDEQRLAAALGQLKDVLDQTSNESLPALILMAELILSGADPDLKLAIDHLERAVTLQPREQSLYPQLIKLLQDSGDLRTAAIYLERLGQLADQHPDVRRAEARLLVDQGEFDAAIVRLVPLVHEDSTIPEQLLLARLHRRVGKDDRAEDIYRRLLEQAPSNGLVARQAADFLASRGRLDEATTVLESMDTGSDPGARFVMLAEFMEVHGSPEAARDWRRRAFADGPRGPETWTRLALTALAANDVDDARRAAASGLALAPTDAGLGALHAALRRPLGETPRLLLLEILRLGGADRAAQPDLLEVLLSAIGPDGRLAPAAATLDEAGRLRRLHGSVYAAWHVVIVMQDAAGEADRAIQIARQAAARFPSQAAPAEWATRLLARAGHLADAEEMARLWRRRSRDNPMTPDAVLAAISIDRGDAESAYRRMEPYAELLRSAPTRYEWARMVWVRCLLQTGRIPEALAAMQRGYPSDDSRWVADWIMALRSVEPATSAAALRLSESDLRRVDAGGLILAEQWTRLARQSRDEAHIREAARCLQEAATTGSDVVTLSLLWGLLESARGDVDAAERSYRHALELDPEHVVALNNLAFLLVTSRERLEEALELSRRARRLKPDDPELLDTEAQVLCVLERFDEAERAARRATGMAPGRPGLHVTLATIHAAQDRWPEARAALARAEALLQSASAGESRAARERIDALRRRIDFTSGRIGARMPHLPSGAGIGAGDQRGKRVRIPMT